MCEFSAGDRLAGDDFLGGSYRNGSAVASRGCGILAPRRSGRRVSGGNRRTSTSSAKSFSALEIPVQLGGGIRSMAQLAAVLALGVDRAILGTVALKQPSLVKQACAEYGARVAVGIDARDGRVATDGWLEVSQKSAVEFAVEMPEVQTLIYTDIKSDGMLKGPNVDATADIINAVAADVIGSGGVTSLADVKALKQIGASGAIIGRALYTGDLALSDAIAAAR